MERNVAEINTIEAFSKFIKDNQFVIVKGTASWCGPCQRMKPLFVELVHQMPLDIAIVIIDIDKAPSLKSKLRIGSVPHMVNYIDGEPMDILTSSNSQKITNFFNQTLKRANSKK